MVDHEFATKVARKDGREESVLGGCLRGQGPCDHRCEGVKTT